SLRGEGGWAFHHGAGDTDPEDRVVVGLRLCKAIALWWHVGGYFVERRRWLELAGEGAGGTDRPELARCLTLLSATLRVAGDLERAEEHATASIDMWRRMGDNASLAM